MYVCKDPLQDKGSAVGRLFFIARPQSQEAGAGGGGKASIHHRQRSDSATSLTNPGIKTAKLTDGSVFAA